jgi:hypothetical protein
MDRIVSAETGAPPNDSSPQMPHMLLARSAHEQATKTRRHEGITFFDLRDFVPSWLHLFADHAPSRHLIKA